MKYSCSCFIASARRIAVSNHSRSSLALEIERSDSISVRSYYCWFFYLLLFTIRETTRDSRDGALLFISITALVPSPSPLRRRRRYQQRQRCGWHFVIAGYVGFNYDATYCSPFLLSSSDSVIVVSAAVCSQVVDVRFVQETKRGTLYWYILPGPTWRNQMFSSWMNKNHSKIQSRLHLLTIWDDFCTFWVWNQKLVQ